MCERERISAADGARAPRKRTHEIAAHSTHLHGIGYAEFGLALAIDLVLTEVFPIQQGQREVDHAGRARTGIAQQQMHAQHLVGGPLERDGPTVVAKAKVLGGGVSVEVARDRFGDDEGKNSRLATVVELTESV